MSHPPSSPYLFDEFFASGKEESVSPFLTPSSRKWGKNLPLRAALLSAIFLAFSFTLSFFHPTTSALLLIPVYFLSGTPAFINALEDIKNLEINIDVLMTLAALLSVIIGSGMEGALLLVLFELSAGMENSVTQKTKGTLLHLHELSPRFASVIEENGILFERSVKEISPGTKLLIKAGEIVPLDGVVIQGSSFVNLVHLTGESQPLAKKTGDAIQAGARNLDGSLTIEVTRTSSDSTLSRIIQLIAYAQEAKPKLERFLDRFGKWYAPIIILLALFFALILPYFLSISYVGPEGSIYRALTFLIAASPCALIIATPTAYLSAINSCARKGILLKGGAVLDALSRCKTIAFDKTGTLTTGQLVCTSVDPLFTATTYDLATALSVAGSLERHAVHPIATAVCNYAQGLGVDFAEVTEFKSIPGSGLQGIFNLDGKSTDVFIGHAAFIDSHLPPESRSLWEKNRERIGKEGHIHTILLIGSSLFIFQFKDAARQITEVLDELKKSGLRLVMLTGDHVENAQVIAKELSIDEVYADLRPEDKLRKVAELSSKEGLMMVGDGVNDAPALARATVGISMGKIGSATAVDASDVVFLNDDLTLLSGLHRKAHQTMAIVKQNLFLALAVIALATTPALLGLIPLWLAVILHEGGTVLVGLNSLRLLK